MVSTTSGARMLYKGRILWEKVLPDGNRDDTIVPGWEQHRLSLVGTIPRNTERMKLVGCNHLDDFATRHADVRSQIDAWRCEVEEAKWASPNDIKARFANASFLADNRVVFNLKGNKYRLDTKVAYKNQVVLIMRIGTHAEYKNWEF